MEQNADLLCDLKFIPLLFTCSLCLSLVDSGTGSWDAERSETSGPSDVCRGLQDPSEEKHDWQVSPSDIIAVTSSLHHQLCMSDICVCVCVCVGFPCSCPCIRSVSRVGRWRTSSAAFRITQSTCDRTEPPTLLTLLTLLMNKSELW